MSMSSFKKSRINKSHGIYISEQVGKESHTISKKYQVIARYIKILVKLN